MCFLPQGQICLIGFLVTDSKYAYNISCIQGCLYLRILLFLNNGSSIQIKSTVSHDQYDANCSWWIKQETCVGKVISLNWPVCFGLLYTFFYKHNDYKDIEAEVSLKTEHILSLFWGWKTKKNKYKKGK